MRRVFIIMAALLLSACASFLPPKPVESEYFTTLGGFFTMTLGQEPSIKYGANIIIKKHLPDSTYALIEFENPANKAQPFVTEGTIVEIKDLFAQRYKNLFVLTSPEVYGVKRHANYAITVSVYSDKSKQLLITRHQQLVNSSYVGD